MVKINQNMHLRFCNSSAAATEIKSSLAPEPTTKGSTPLVVLLSWLMAREKYLEKYREIYLKRGFDVLTVKTRPDQFLFPTVGTQVVAQSLFDFLKNQVGLYPNVVVHGFSVGAYQFSEFMVKLQDGLHSKGSLDGSCEIVRKSIKGVIFDSAVDVEGAPYGVAKSVAGNSKIADLIESSIRGYMKLCYPFATKHYEKASGVFCNTPLRCPALLLVSQDDKLGNPLANERVRDRWQSLGIDVTWKCWDKSRHVAHLQNYPQEYRSIVNQFLSRINLIPNDATEEESEQKAAVPS